jgi:hypothetical protein
VQRNDPAFEYRFIADVLARGSRGGWIGSAAAGPPLLTLGRLVATAIQVVSPGTVRVGDGDPGEDAVATDTAA